jgi:hypothetical protein
MVTTDRRWLREGELGWYAHPPQQYLDDEAGPPPSVEGTHIRLMCDYGVAIPALGSTASERCLERQEAA